MAFVLDASVTMAWCFEDEADDLADAALHALEDEEAFVPSLWTLEVANVLLVAERQERLAEADALRFVRLLEGLPVRVDRETAGRAWAETRELARTHDLSAYDAAYLELAIRLALPLATRDDGLRTARGAAGVDLFRP